MPYTIGETLRLASLDDFDMVFTRDSTSIYEGRWTNSRYDGTPSMQTGPGENSVGTFVYTESSGGATNDQLELNSAAAVLATVMAAWPTAHRKLTLRASIAGRDTFATAGGLMIEGRAAAADNWSTIQLLAGWAHSDTYAAGDTLTDNAGTSHDIAQDGGWVDFTVDIPAAYTEVRLRIEAIESQAYQHDIALWQVQLHTVAPPAPPPPSVTEAPGLTDIAITIDKTLTIALPAVDTLSDTITYSLANLPAGATFTPATRVLRWTPRASAAKMVTYTATDGADTVFQRFLLMAHAADLPTYAILIDWDGDGSYSHPLSDAFIDLTKAGVHTKRGRNYASMIYGRSVAGTLEATLTNHDGDYDRFAPTSELQGLLLPRRRLMFLMAWQDTAYRLWSGYLDKLNKKARTGGNDIVQILATDIIGNLARTDCGVSYRETITVKDGVTAVLTAAGVPDADRGEINGDTMISIYFAADAKALLHLRHLEEAEAGFLWVTGAGKVNFDSVNQRYQQTRSRQVQVTITDEEDYGPDDLPLLPPPQEVDPLKDLANIVEVKVRTWLAESEADLWTLPEVIEMAAGDVRTFLVSAPRHSPRPRRPHRPLHRRSRSSCPRMDYAGRTNRLHSQQRGRRQRQRQNKQHGGHLRGRRHVGKANPDKPTRRRTIPRHAGESARTSADRRQAPRPRAPRRRQHRRIWPPAVHSGQ